MGVDRIAGTTYTNTTGKPIMVSAEQINTGTGAAGLTGQVNGADVAKCQPFSNGANFGGGITFIVPPNATYTVISNASNGNIAFWSELR